MKLIQVIKEFINPKDKNARIEWSLYGRVWREIGRPYWKWLAAGVIFAIGAAGAEAYSIMLVKKVMDNGFIEKNMGSLYIIGMQIIVAFGFKGLFTYGKTVLMSKAGLLAATGLRRRIYRHMVKLHLGHFKESRTGDLLNFYTIQANAVLALVTETVINSVQNLATLLMMLGMMIWVAPQMVALLVFLIPAIIIPLMIITRKRRILTRQDFGAASSSTAHINQTILGIKTIQAYCAEEKESGNMDQIEDVMVSKRFKLSQLVALQSPILEIMIAVGMAIALVYGGHFITTGSISPGDFVAFILALTAAYQPAKKITSVNNTLQTGLLAAEQLFEFLDLKPLIKDQKGAVAMPKVATKVGLSNVSFSYVKSQGQVLKNVDLVVNPGQICALVGPSGGGKSTILNLLERFYEPDSGAVEFNGTDIRKHTLKSLRGNIAEVSQDVFLFAGSVAENIAYGSPNATREQVIEAAKMANAHEFIVKMAEGYDTNVGERGGLLSGGQKQRVAIARAILKDAPVLLLDEATSALDTHSEKLIQAALKKLMVGRTTFVIAHRLSTILDADMICVVKGGEIIERGTDAELIALGGEYKKLRDIQFKEK
jgi:subfamily B ATP-binding cassette protein MsbA